MKISSGKKVKMEYELAVEGGEVIESSETRGPIEYIHGTGTMLPGLESRIEGMAVGEETEGSIPPEEGYGTEDTLPTMDIPRSDFPEAENLEVGKEFQAADPKGNPLNFTIVEILEESVKVRFNHPLAGKTIRFKVKILEVSDPN